MKKKHMLRTPQDRVKLLKARFDGKTIEKLYLICNNFKIECIPVLFEVVEITASRNCHEKNRKL